MSELNLLRLSQDLTVPLRKAWKNKVHFCESASNAPNDSGNGQWSNFLKAIRRRWNRMVHTIALSQKLWHGRRESSCLNNPISNHNNKYRMYLSFGIATLLCHPFTHPIYSLLIRQLAAPGNSQGILKNISQAMARMKSGRGWLGMYRGGLTSLLSYFISLASDCVEHFLIRKYAEKNQLSRWKIIISVAVFMVSFMIRFPLDVVTTKMILNTNHHYFGALSTVLQIIREDGVSGLYSGWTASLMMSLTNGLYQSLISGRTPRAVEALFNGVKLILQFIFMVIRITMNSRSYNSYNGAMDCFRHILRARGWSGLFSSLWMYLWIAPFCIPWLLLSSSIYYHLVEASNQKNKKNTIDRKNKLTRSEPTLSSAERPPEIKRSASY